MENVFEMGHRGLCHQANMGIQFIFLMSESFIVLYKGMDAADHCIWRQTYRDRDIETEI